MKDPNNPCIFCAPREHCGRNALAYATRDTYPVSPGHTLIIPVRHCADLFDLSRDEIGACMTLLAQQRESLARELKPDGYNVGVNVGEAAGQSIFHVHIHLIPRYRGDDPQPRGGVRNVLSHKADYPRH